VYHTVNDNVRVPGFLPREFVARQVWQQQDAEKLVVIYEGFEHTDYPMRPEYVRGSSTTSFAYVKLPPVSGVPQTHVTFTAEIGMGGYIPINAQKIGTTRVLRSLSVARKRFDRSSEIDRGTRMRNAEMIMGHTDEYSAEEAKLLEDGEAQFAMFKGTKAKVLKMTSPLATAKIAFKSGDNHAWGWATTTVRASPEEVLAYLWDVMKRSARRGDDLGKSVEERANGHNMVAYNEKRTPKIFANRDFLSRCVWKKTKEEIVYVTSPEESEMRPIKSSVVRAKYPSAIRIKRKNDKETTLGYVIHPDLGGGVPAFLMNFYTAKNLRRVTEVQEYFQALRGLKEWGADDGRAVGEVMCIKTKAEKYCEKGESKVGARMRELFKKQKGLKMIAEKYVREASVCITNVETRSLLLARANISLTRACLVPPPLTFDSPIYSRSLSLRSQVRVLPAHDGEGGREQAAAGGGGEEQLGQRELEGGRDDRQGARDGPGESPDGRGGC